MDLAVLALFACYAALWQGMILHNAPRIIESGDGGVIGGIVAAHLWPQRFVEDIVYRDPSNFSFYWSAIIPITIALATLLLAPSGSAVSTDPIGQC